VSRFFRVVVPALAGALAGCGHDVEPTAAFRDPASIPRVSNFQVVQQPQGVNLLWEIEPGAFAIIDGFFMFKAVVVPGGDLVFTRLNETPFLESSYLDTKVAGGVEYAYEVRGVTPAGVIGDTPLTLFIEVDFTPPAPPEFVFAEAFRDSIDLGGEIHVFDKVGVSWTASADHDVVSYRLHRLPPFPILTYIEIPFLEFEDTAVEPAMTYRYYVQAVDDNGNVSVESPVAMVTVPFDGSP
jgi:hypothetical protein